MGRDYNFWLYIITNAHDSVLYIGMTNDLGRRVSEHRSGERRGFTSVYRCHKLLYYEHYTDVHDAIGRAQLKKWSRAKKWHSSRQRIRAGTTSRRRSWVKSKRCLGYARHDKRFFRQCGTVFPVAELTRTLSTLSFRAESRNL